MALRHAKPGQIVDLGPLGPALQNTKTVTLAKTSDLELIRLVLPAGKQIATHRAPREITVQCLAGRVSFVAGGTARELAAGQMLWLEPGRHTPWRPSRTRRCW